MNPDGLPIRSPPDDDIVHLKASFTAQAYRKLVYDDLLVVKASVECKFNFIVSSSFTKILYLILNK